MSKANFETASDVFDGWRDDLLTGEPPVFYPAGEGELSRIEIGPELVTLIGGSPGAGKTAFTMQLVVDALRLNPTLRVVTCNIEMSPEVLLDRQLSRLSGIDAKTIRYRKLDGSHAKRLDLGLNTLGDVAERLCFVRPPYTLENVAATADEFGADLLTLDYIQRIQPPGEHGDRRGSVDASMDYIRQFADAGTAVIVVAAVSRQKDAKGRSSYAGDSLSLASFRESSELEFGADDAFILSPDSDTGDVVLRHLKSRHGEASDIRLRFDRKRQSFTAKPSEVKPDGKLQKTIDAMWQQTEAAPEDDE